MHLPLSYIQNDGHTRHMDSQPERKADPSGTDTGYWYTGAYHSRNSESIQVPESHQNGKYQSLPGKIHLLHHKCCHNSGTSSYHLTERTGQISLSPALNQTGAWKPEYNKLCVALYFHVADADFHNVWVRS